MAARKSRAKAKAARPTTTAAYLGLHFKELDDLELTSVAKVIAMSTPKE